MIISTSHVTDSVVLVPQWTATAHPDPSGEQYRVMVDALQHIINTKGWPLEQAHLG